MNFRADFRVKAPGGENYTDVCLRVRDFWNEIKDKGYGKIVIVSHYRAISCLMKEILALGEEETLRVRVPICEPIIINI